MPHFHKFISESEFFSGLTKVEVFHVSIHNQINSILQIPSILAKIHIGKIAQWITDLCEYKHTMTGEYHKTIDTIGTYGQFPSTF